MDKEIQKGKSTREAAKVSAQKTGHNDNSIRSAHQRAEKKKREVSQPVAWGKAVGNLGVKLS